MQAREGNRHAQYFRMALTSTARSRIAYLARDFPLVVQWVTEHNSFVPVLKQDDFITISQKIVCSD